MPLTACMLVEEIDGLGERENSDVARENDGNSGDNDKHRSHIVGNRFRYRRAGEEGHAKVNKDEILRKLSEGREDVFCCSLGSLRHGVIGVMLQSDATE